jgi:hypothetical protein
VLVVRVWRSHHGPGSVVDARRIGVSAMRGGGVGDVQGHDVGNGLEILLRNLAWKCLQCDCYNPMPCAWLGITSRSSLW